MMEEFWYHLPTKYFNWLAKLFLNKKILRNCEAYFPLPIYALYAPATPQYILESILKSININDYSNQHDYFRRRKKYCLNKYEVKLI